MYKIFLVIIALFLVRCQPPKALHINGRTMGTTYHLVLADKNFPSGQLAHVQQKTDSLLQVVNQQMSTYMPESEISRFNRFEKSDRFTVSPAFTRVLRLALQINRESGGLFDVTVAPLVNLWGFGTKGNRNNPPSDQEINTLLKEIGSRYIEVVNDTTIRKNNPKVMLDFSAIAKGFGVDEVAGLLQALNFQNFLVEIGGEVVTRGTKFGQPWKIGIDRPLPDAVPGSNLEAVLHLQNAAMATSGDYRNYFTSGDSLYSHEIDPRSGRPIQTGVASVTVLAPSCMLADAMATAIMVMGAQKGRDWVESKPGVEAMIIVHSASGFKEIMSSGFKKMGHWE